MSLSKRCSYLSGISVLTLVLLVLSGCVAAASGDPTLKRGVFLDSAVEGLSYETSTLSGITDAAGTFSYHEGEVVRFSVGRVELGKAVGAAVVTPLTLVPGAKYSSHPAVTNIARFLQSLDEDENPANGISISQGVRRRSDTLTVAVEFDLGEGEFEKQAGIRRLFDEGKGLVAAKDAQEHLSLILLDAREEEGFQKALDETVAAYGWPGGVMAARFPGGQVWMGKTGQSDIFTPKEMSLDDHFRVGSVTKTFTGSLILILAQEGLLSLDDTVEKWLPGKVINGANITIRQLMVHSSGLDNYWHASVFNKLFVDTSQMILDKETFSYTPDFLIEENNFLGVRFDPNAKWAYSNIGPVIEALIIEKVTGSTYEEQLATRIFQPLGLSETSFPTTADMPEPFAHGYYDGNLDGKLDNLNADDWSLYNPSFAWASGGIVTTVANLLDWTTFVNDGKVGGVELIGEKYQNLRRSFFMALPGGEAGSGLHLFNEKGAVGHKGDIFGYQAVVQRYSGVDFAVIVNGQFINGVNPPENTGNVAQLIFWNAIASLTPETFEPVKTIFDISTGIMEIPALAVQSPGTDAGFYSARITYNSDAITSPYLFSFSLEESSVEVLSTPLQFAAVYDPGTNMLHLPRVTVKTDEQSAVYRMDFSFGAGNADGTFGFLLMDAERIE